MVTPLSNDLERNYTALKDELIAKGIVSSMTSFPYQYEFADRSYAAKFKLEVLIGKLSALFAGLAILISYGTYRILQVLY